MKKILMSMSMVWAALFPLLSHAEEPIYIGLSAPITGQYAGYGDSLKKGAELAIGQINAGGGINGHLIELVPGDSQGVPKLAKRVARKFAEDKRILATIGDATSSCCMTAQSIYNRGKLVQFSPTASHPSFAPGSPYSFAINSTQSGTSRFMAHTAVNTLGKKKLSLLYLNNDWGVIAQKFFVEEAQKLGAEITAAEGYLEGITDFSPILEKIRGTKPELLFLFSMYGDAAMISRQRREIGWEEVTVMGADTLYLPEFLEKAGDAAEGIYVFAAFFPEDPNSEVQKFVRGYKEKYNSMPDITAALAYDAMNILNTAIRKDGTGRETLRNALAGIKDFPGVTGKITFDPHGSVSKTSKLLQVKNGNFEIVN